MRHEKMQHRSLSVEDAAQVFEECGRFVGYVGPSVVLLRIFLWRMRAVIAGR